MGEKDRAWCVGLDLAGGMADFWVGSSVGKSYRSRLSCFRLDVTDGRMFGGVLGVGEIWCWVFCVRIEGTDGRQFCLGAGRGTDIVLGVWARLNGSYG
jgi:hypothetical protein